MLKKNEQSNWYQPSTQLTEQFSGLGLVSLKLWNIFGRAEPVLVNLYLNWEKFISLKRTKRTSVNIKNMCINHPCNRKVWNFATALRVRNFFGTFERRAPGCQGVVIKTCLMCTPVGHAKGARKFTLVCHADRGEYSITRVTQIVWKNKWHKEDPKLNECISRFRLQTTNKLNNFDDRIVFL